MYDLPGHTELGDYKIQSISHLIDIKQLSDRKVILLATNDINDDNLFMNGLNQNVLVFYDLFETMGYNCYLIQNKQLKPSEKSEYLCRYKILTPEDVIRNPLPILLYMEIGMSLDSNTRNYLKMNGANIVKLYLGNILNIDIETAQSMPETFFFHHIVGEIDEIWMSPHYKQNLEYGAVLNRTDISKGRIVPYVWEPSFLTKYNQTGMPKWKIPDNWRNIDIVIMDPTISFQKSFFYSLLLAEKYAKFNPEWRGKVIIMNGDRQKYMSHVSNNILPNLTLHNDNRIKLEGRKNIKQIMEANPSAVFITSQWNNDFNYATFEQMFCGFPVLHNSIAWKDYGYYYSLNDWSSAVELLDKAIRSHKDFQAVYETHAKNLAWRHSIYNPEVQAEWREILDSLH